MPHSTVMAGLDWPSTSFRADTERRRGSSGRARGWRRWGCEAGALLVERSSARAGLQPPSRHGRAWPRPPTSFHADGKRRRGSSGRARGWRWWNCGGGPGSRRQSGENKDESW